ncbi:MAG: hypothetical protein KH304_00825 [Clostridium sp.]|nr:hypothetical protein [Clostridium sp.]
MGFTFRKSKENAPDEKMDSYRGRKTKTDRMKGVHNKGKSKGKRTPVISLPGSRVSKRKTSSAKNSSKKIHNNHFIKKKESLLPEEPKKKKGKGCLTVFIVLFVLGGIFTLFTRDNKLETIVLSADENNRYDINTAIPVDVKTTPSNADLKDIECETSGGELKKDGDNLRFTTEKSGSYTMYVLCGDIKSNTITITVEDKAALAEKEAQEKAETEAAKRAEEEAAKKAEEEAAKKAKEEAAKKAEEEAAKKAEEERKAAEAAAQKAEEERIAAEAAAQESSQANQVPQEQMVWIPQSGSKYHNNPSCSGMNNPQQVTLSEAESMGFAPCKKCY